METVHVLVISSYIDDAITIEKLLRTDKNELRHYYVNKTDTYEDAIKALTNNKYDIFFIDEQLAELPLTGLELIERANAGGCATPCIVITDKLDHNIENTIDHYGAASFINRYEDLTPRILQRTICYAVKYFKQLQEIRSQLIDMQHMLASVSRRLKG